MEYNGVNSGDQTDKAEMLNSLFTEFGLSLSRGVTEADKSHEECLLKLTKISFLKKQHQHMFLHHYQSFVSQRQLD